MPHLFYGHLQTRGVRINYYRTGDDKPPLILLHGLGEAALSWGAFPVMLEPEYDVVLVDARGHGYSQAPEDGYGPDEQAADVLAVMDELKLERPALVGHSMGAVVAAAVAVQAPERVRAVVLEDMPHQAPPNTPEQRAERAARWEEEILRYKPLSLDELIDLVHQLHPGWHPDEAFQWAKARQLVSPRAAAFNLAEWMDWDTTFALLKVPGLLLTANPERGGLVTPELAERAARLWPQGQVVHFPDAGHNIHREQFKDFLNTVRRYLRRVP